ncbi:MAG: diacylglycerol kinase family protein [Candidatus Aminicenantes bacterium]|nr:MAG: diacylglycerol kinase family protein [Candidatus Aminicenantes bacterium]
MKDKRFSISRRIKSFGYAFKGIFLAFKTQHNIWIHSLAIVVVVTAGFIFKLDVREWGLVVLAIGLVLISEMVNTAIEWLVDLVSPDYREKAGLIKDVAAGAVLIAAIISVIIGGIVFLPKIIELMVK